MSVYATRAPLQLIENPHMMSELRGHGRRTSARLADKEDEPITNGNGYNYEPAKKGQNIGASGKQGKASTHGASAKTGAKRKPGEGNPDWQWMREQEAAHDDVEMLRMLERGLCWSLANVLTAYDEEDDGFAFTRTRSKKAKAEPIKQQPVIPEEQTDESGIQPRPIKKSRKKSVGSPSPSPRDDRVRVEKRRSTRHSGGHDNADPQPVPVEKKRKARDSAESKADHVDEELTTFTQYNGHMDQQEPTQPVEITFDATKIALPFADTPIIRRNKEMRKGAQNGSRRSSLGMRGRRASSLIDTGRSNALPHDEVESAEFYKHIESEGLSEPRRMRQLLTWCGSRALGDKPSFSSEDGNARLAAREIQSQLLKDFSTRSDMSDWFNRNEATPPPSVPKPNPKNLSNLAKIQDLEQQIARLESERQVWQTLLRPPPDSAVQLPPLPRTPAAPSTIDSALLTDPGQKAALSVLESSVTAFQPSLTAAISSRIQRINQNLEFEVDKFADNVHALDAYKNAAGRIADEVLAASAEALEKRDREGTRRAAADGGDLGMRDVLRGLSRVIDR